VYFVVEAFLEIKVARSNLLSSVSVVSFLPVALLQQ